MAGLEHDHALAEKKILRVNNTAVNALTKICYIFVRCKLESVC